MRYNYVSVSEVHNRFVKFAASIKSLGESSDVIIMVNILILLFSSSSVGDREEPLYRNSGRSQVLLRL